MMSLYQLFKAKGPSGFGYGTTAEQVPGIARSVHARSDPAGAQCRSFRPR
jgi:hypothetical protein